MRPVPALSPEHLPRSKFLLAWFGAFLLGDVELVGTDEGPADGWFIVVALGGVGCFVEGRAHYKCRLEEIMKRVSFWVLAFWAKGSRNPNTDNRELQRKQTVQGVRSESLAT